MYRGEIIVQSQSQLRLFLCLRQKQSTEQTLRDLVATKLICIADNVKSPNEFTRLLSHIVRDYPIHHDDVIKWKYFPRYWPFVRGIHRSTVTSRHKGQWRGASMFSLICARINDWVNNREAGDFERHRSHYDVIEMIVAQWRHVAGDFLVNNDSDTGFLPDGTRPLLGIALSYDQAEWWTRFFFLFRISRHATIRE